MPAKLPQRVNASPSHRPAHRRDGDNLAMHHEVRIEGQLKGLWGGIAAIIFLLLLAVVFVLGLMTLTVVLWIACGAILLAMLTAFLRLFTGDARRGPPPTPRP